MIMSESCLRKPLSGSGSVFKLGLRIQFLTSFMIIGFVIWGWIECLMRVPRHRCVSTPEGGHVPISSLNDRPAAPTERFTGNNGSDKSE